MTGDTILPLQQLHQLFVTAEKREHVSGFRILFDILLHGSGEPVERFTQIHRSRTVVDSYRTAEAEHGRAPIRFNTSDSVAPSKPFSSTISMPPTANLIPDAFPALGMDGATSTSSSDSDPSDSPGRSFFNVRIHVSIDSTKVQVDYACSPEYWCGWVLAYFQWFTGRSFQNIHDVISMREMEQLYPALHEASEERFVDAVNRIIRKKNLPTRLQARRKDCGFTQKILGEKSGVNLRTLQQYELRAKDINKAAAGTLRALAMVLSCEIEALLEFDCFE